MRITMVGMSPQATVRPRTPGVILLAHDLKILICQLIRITQRLRKHDPSAPVVRGSN
jgi:hypothetical protein